MGLVGGQQPRTQDTADLVEWVVGDAGEWMTGQTLVSDGGSFLGWTRAGDDKAPPSSSCILRAYPRTL